MHSKCCISSVGELLCLPYTFRLCPKESCMLIFLLSHLLPRAIPVPPQTAPPPRMVNLCQASQTAIIAPNPMLQGALLMQQMQGRVLITVQDVNLVKYQNILRSLKFKSSFLNPLSYFLFNPLAVLLSSRQHEEFWNGWTAVPSVLHSFIQVVPAWTSSHGHGHQVPHHRFPSCSTVPPTCALL